MKSRQRPLTEWWRSKAELWLLVALSLFACTPGGRKEALRHSVQIRLQIRSSLGEGLEGVDVHSRYIGAQASRSGIETLLSNAEGQVWIAVPPSGGLSLSATCPLGYTGASLERQLSRALLESSERWSLELVCEPEELPVTIAILSRGCGELSLDLDGEPLGQTKEGVLHTVVSRRSARWVELTATPVREGCVLKESTRILELKRPRPNLWLKFVGEKKKVPKSRGSRKKKSEPSRPYRL